MIEAIRRYTSSWIVKTLFMLLVLSFVLWGVADVFRPGAKQEWAAEIDGTTIPVEVFAREYQQQARRIRNNANAPMSAEELVRAGLPQMVIERMVNMQILDNTADRLDLMVSRDDVTKSIAADPRFRNKAGQFDPQIFSMALREAGLNEALYLARLQNDLRREQVVASVGNTVAVPTPLSDVLARYFFEDRVAQYVTVPLAAAADVGTPDPAQLKAFYDENAGLFTAPEYRKVTAIILDANDLAKDIAVSQQDLETAYADRADEFIEPERRSFQQLVFADAARAREAGSKLAAGADFSAVGQEMLGEKPEDLAVNDVKRGSLPASLADAVFTQAPGTVSAPIETPLGWHIVKVTEVKPGSQRSLDEVRDTLTAAVRLERATDALIDLGNKLDDALGRGLKLEDAAKELNLPIRTIDAIDPEGHDHSGKAVPGISPAIAQTAFATAAGEDSLLTEASPTTMFVLRVDEVTPAAEKPFDTVQKEVAEGWRANRRIELARQRAEGLAARIRSDQDLASVADTEHLKLEQTPKLSRATLNTHPDVPRPVTDATFDSGNEKTFVVRDVDAFYVGRVVSVEEPPAATLQQNDTALREQLAGAVASDVTQQFLNALRGEHDVRINRPALEKAL